MEDQFLRICNNIESDFIRSGIFTVFAVPAIAMEPAYNLMPAISYNAVKAILTGCGIEKSKIDGKDRVIFNRASPENTLEWNITFGAVDIIHLPFLIIIRLSKR